MVTGEPLTKKSAFERARRHESQQYTLRRWNLLRYHILFGNGALQRAYCAILTVDALGIAKIYSTSSISCICAFVHIPYEHKIQEDVNHGKNWH